MGKLLDRISLPGVVMILVGIFLLYQGIPDLMTSFRTPKSFDELLEDGGLSEGDHVQGRVPFLLDSFAIEETWQENTSNNSRTPKKTSRYYYVFPCGDGVAGLSVNASEASLSNKLVDETYAYLADEGDVPETELVLDARAMAMDEELSELFEEELKEYYDFTNAEIAELGTFLMITPRSFTAARVLSGVGAGLIVLGVLLTVRLWRKTGEPKSRDDEKELITNL